MKDKAGPGGGNGVLVRSMVKRELLDFQKNIIKIKFKDGYEREWEGIKL